MVQSVREHRLLSQQSGTNYVNLNEGHFCRLTVTFLPVNTDKNSQIIEVVKKISLFVPVIKHSFKTAQSDLEKIN